MTKKELTIDDVNQALIEFAKDENNLNEKNPYKKIKLKEVFDNFFESLEKNDSDFSWVEKLNGIDKKKNVEDKDKIANIHYGLPSHVHGNYRDGLIYLCLFNPNVVEIQDSNLIYKSEKSKKKSTKICNIKDYYTKPPMVEGKNDLANEEFWTIINGYKTWYKNKEKEENINKLVDIIISEESTLTKELKNMDKDHYYIDKYYKVLKNEVIDKLESNDKKYKITDRIVNIDLCPFRAKNAGTVTNEILNTQFSEFSAYIIWYRIGKYLNDLENYRKNIVRQIEKPLFIFRSYSKWQDKLVATLHKIHNKEIDNEIIEGYIEKINLEFFYHFPNQSGMISQNNLKKFVSKDEFDGIKGLISIQNWKNKYILSFLKL